MNKLLELLKSVAKNPLVRKAFVGLVMAILAALGYAGATGCSSLLGSNAPALTPVQVCVIDALKPIAGDQAQALAMQLIAGETVALPAPTPELLQAAVADLDACAAQYLGQPQKRVDL